MLVSTTAAAAKFLLIGHYRAALNQIKGSAIAMAYVLRERIAVTTFTSYV